MISTAPNADLVNRFNTNGRGPRPCIGQIGVCWARTDEEARRTAFECWPNAGLPGELGQELATPAHFEQACQMVREEDVAKAFICSSDPARHIEGIRKYVEAGFDHIYIRQVGPDQEVFSSSTRKKCCQHFNKKHTAGITLIPAV